MFADLSIDIIIALISLIGVVVSAIITNYYRKQVNIENDREKLIKTLKDLVEAQDQKIKNLEATIAESTQEIKNLRAQVDELREVIVSQAVLIENLSAK